MKNLIVSLIISCLATSGFAQLNGTYTIGGTNPSYPDFTTAISALSTSGISGNVTFNVRPGTYTERFEINSIPGNSATRTITIQAENGDSSSVILSNPTATNTTNFLIAIFNTQNVNIKKMTLTGPSTGAYGNVLIVYGGSGFKLENCRVSGILSGSPSTVSQDVIQFGNTMTGFQVRNCTLRGGNRTIGVYGGSTSLPNNGLIEQNLFLKASTSAFRAQYSNNLVLTKNRVDSCGVQGFIAFQVNYCSTAVVSFNRLELDGGLGFGFTACYSGNTSRMQIHNNFVSVVSTAQGSGGMYLQDSRYVDLYYNSFNVQHMGEDQTYCLQISNSGAFQRIQNNSFVITPGNIVVNNLSGANVLEQYSHNNLYNGEPQTNLPPNSVSFNPGYANASDLHLSGSALNNIGTPVSITTDIDGQTRSASTPDIGADEFSPVNTSAGVASLVNPSPDSVYCETLPLSFYLINSGTSALTSVQILATVNGTSSTTNWSGNLPSGQQVLVELGDFPLINFVSNTVNVQLSLPNGGSDDFTPDNTLAFTGLYTGLSGVYTVGGASPTFPGFYEIAANLEAGGVCGDVTFKIRNGTYVEHLFLNPIKGASANARILFEGESGDSSLVTLTAAGTNTLPSTVRLNAARFIGFKHMTIAQMGSVYNYTPLHMSYGTDLSLEHCEIRAYTTFNSSSSDHALVAFPDSNLSIRYCRIQGGSGTACNLVGTGPTKYNLIFEHNQMISGLDDGIDVRNWTRMTMNHNIITGGGSNTSYAVYGLGLINFDFSYNYVTGTGAQGSSALYLINNGSGTTGIRNRISNNSLNTSLGVDVIAVGMCLRLINTNNTDIIHNTIRHNSLDTDNFAANISNSSGISFMNNIVANTGLGIAFAYGGITNSTCDYNSYYTGGTVLIGGTNDLAAIQAITGGDEHSIVADPMFLATATDNLYPGNPLIENIGLASSILDDIKGNPRAMPNPDLGAFESVSAPVVDLGDDLSACGSVLINGMVPGASSYLWSNGETTSSIEITTSGTYSLTVTNDIGSDSDTLVVEILDLPEVFAGNDTSICADASLVLNGISNGACTWTSDGSIIATACGDVLVTPISYTPYVLTALSPDGCELSDTLFVSIDQNLSPVIVQDGNYLTVQNDGQIQWFKDGDLLIDETNDSLLISGSGDYTVQITSSNGCLYESDVFTVTITSTLSLNESTFRVYPNPSKIGNWHVTTLDHASYQVELRSLDGRLIFQANNASSIDNSSLAPGMYVLKITHQQGQEILRLLKQ